MCTERREPEIFELGWTGLTEHSHRAQAGLASSRNRCSNTWGTLSDSPSATAPDNALKGKVSVPQLSTR